MLAGCAQVAPQPPSRRELREAEMNRRWRNQPLSELVAAMGQPVRVMGIPCNPEGLAVVYGLDVASDCIDAFAFTEADDPVIRLYHCR